MIENWKPQLVSDITLTIVQWPEPLFLGGGFHNEWMTRMEV